MMTNNYMICCIICFILLIVIVGTACIKNKKSEDMESILNFFKPIIITGMVLCSIIYLTKFSHESNTHDINCSDSKSKEKNITKNINTNQCININIDNNRRTYKEQDISK